MKLSPPPIQLLPAFEAAARHLSFKKAAEELHVTPSAVSQQIKTLEQWLEDALFKRESGGVILTPVGQDMYRLAQTVLDKYRHGYSDIYQQQAKPIVRISSIAYVAQNILIPALPEFQKTYPDIDLRIESSESLVDFDKDWVDFGVRIGIGEDNKLSAKGQWTGLESIELTNLTATMLAAPSFIEANPLIKLDDVASWPLIHSRTNYDDWKMFEKLFSVDLSESRHIYFNNYLSAVTAAENGMGVMLGMLPLSNPSLKNNRLAKIIEHEGPINQGCYLVYPPEKSEKAEFEIIKNWIQQVMADL